MLKEKTDKYFWCNNGVDFTCKMCGACCGGESGYVWLTEVEKTAIACYLNITIEELETLYLHHTQGKWSIKERSNNENFDCVFLEEGRCSIYPVRSAQCRDFPFWESMLANKDEWDFYATRCPGMNSGKHYTLEEIKEIIKAKQNQYSEAKK